MTASAAREVEADLLRGAARGSTQAHAHAEDTGREDLGDLVQALGRGHQFGVEGLGHGEPAGSALHLITYRPARRSVGQQMPLVAITAIPIYQR
jgi:hypothetical protein